MPELTQGLFRDLFQPLTGSWASARGIGGGSPALPSVTLPTPAFGASNALGWWDITQTIHDNVNGDRLGVGYDTIGWNTVPYLLDLLGLGSDWWQPVKDLQPSKGPNGGPMFDTAGQYMRMFGDAWTSPLFNGLSQFSMYWRVRPLAGTTKRTILYSTQAASSGAKALGPGTIVPGTGYRVGSYLTVVGGTGTVALFKVNAIDGSGGVTGVDLIDGGGYSVAPTSPAAVTETYPSTAVTPAGTGCTLSLIMSAKGNGGNFARVIHNITSGTGTRKQSMDYIFGDVGTTVTTSASSTTSLGAPNGAALTDTTTFHTLGMEVDFAAGTVNYRYDGAADGSLSITPGVLNNADAVSMLLGNSPAFTALGLFELKAGLLLSEIPSSGRRSSIETYMGAL